MSMTIQDLRDYVRVSLDTDEIELPDALLDPWCVEAQARVRASLDSNHQLQTIWSFSTTQGVQVYPYTDFSAGDDVAEVLTVEGPNYTLQPISHAAAQDKWSGYHGTGVPSEFSIHADSMYFWPTPSDTNPYIVRGLRAMNITTTAGAVPDCPEDFHSLIGEYMLARAYEQQDDEIMSQQKFQRFENSVALLAKKYNRANRSGIRTIGRVPRPTRQPNRNYYDWE